MAARREAAEHVQCDASDILRIGGGSRALAEAKDRLAASERRRDHSEARHWHRVVGELRRRKRLMIAENADERYRAANRHPGGR